MNISDSPAMAAAPRGEERRHGLGVTARRRATHPSATVLRRFARGKATREQGRQVVSHLLGGCPACGEAIAGVARLTGPKEA